MPLHSSIQRGSVTLASAGAVTNVTISAVTLARAWLVCTVRSPSDGPQGYQVQYRLSSTTNIELRVNIMTTANVVVEWQVIEFTVASGITVQHGSWTTEASITISAVTVSRAMVQANLQMAGLTLGADDFVRPKITGTTTLTTNDGQTSIKYYQIVDWGVHATVQHVDITVLTTDTGTKDTTITTLTDYTKTVVIGHCEYGAGIVGTDFGNLYCTSNTNLRFIRSGGARALTVTAQVIEFTASNIAVQQFISTLGTGNSSTTATLSTVNTSNTLIIPASSTYNWSRTDHAGDIAGHFSLTYTLTNSTTVTLTRATTGTTSIASFSVLDFSDASSGSLSASLNINLNNLDISSSTSVSGTALVTSVSSDKPDGTYTTGEEIYISVEFSRPVSVSGTPQLDLAVKSGGYKVNYVAMKSPLDVVSLAGWYDASDTSTITQSGGLVSQWNDKSGNSRHLIQSNDTLKPLSHSAAIGSLNALDFHSVTADKISTSAAYTVLNSTAYSILAVVKYDTAGGYFIGIGQPSNYTGLHTGYRNTTQYTLDHYNAGVDITVTPNTSTPMILNPQFNNLGSNIRINGSSIGSSGGFPAFALSATTGVLNIGNGHDTSNPFNGMIGEVLIYTGALSDANREQLEGILAHKWGLTSYLSGSHPYKNRPPLVS